MKTNKSVLILTALILAGAQASANDVLVEKKAGRKPASELKIKGSGVPQFDIYQTKKSGGKTETYRLKNIPRLNIGEEPSLSAAKVPGPELPASREPKLVQIQKRNSPPEVSVEKYLNLKEQGVADAKTVRDVLKIADVPLFNEPLPVQDPLLMKPELHQVEVKDLSPVELKLLQALIFLEIQKNYPMALGLFAELLDEAPHMRTEATYQLALTSLGLGLYSEYKFQMMKVLDDKNVDWQKRAATSLAKNAAEGDLALVPVLDPKLEKHKLELDKIDQYRINQAKYYLNEGDIKTAQAAVDKIDMASPLYLSSQFLRAVLSYKAGQVQEGIAALSNVLAEYEKKKDVEMKSIAALTLGRMMFQTGDYKNSFQTFLKVDKTHAEWPQAMIEQAWAQILAGDDEGAAGNMFSLHTAFFKNTFAPESYVVRTVSYLNLCQFGDGARTVQELKKRYAGFQEKMAAYKKAHTNNLDFYETVKVFMKNGEAKEIDGLPRSFVWALARHPNFMLEQKNINGLEEQVARYNRITMDLIKREKFLLGEQTKIRGQIVGEKKKLKAGETNSRIQDLEKRMVSFQIQHHIVKKARVSIKDLRAAGLVRVEKEKNDRKVAASKALENRFNGLMTSLTSSLDQTDVLQYELYAGAGEHLRYQAAGGDIDPKEVDGLKPEKKKQLNWEFKGEVWEDELGHYRSSLRNVCPADGESKEQVTAVDHK